MLKGIIGDGLWRAKELGVLFTTSSGSDLDPRFDTSGATTFKWISPDGSVSTGAFPIPILDQIGDYKITSTDWSKADVFEIDRDNLTALSNLRLMTALTRLFCNRNALSVLDVSELVFLTQLMCHENNISVLDVSAMSSMQVLRCHDNSISVLDVSAMSGMEELICRINDISVLDVSGMEDVEVLLCNGNNIASLDLDGASALVEFSCSSNSMVEAAIDNVLAGLVTAGGLNGEATMTGDNAPPSAAGEINKAILIGRGWTVETN